MELLVVMGIFSLTVMIATSIFMQSNKAQRRVLVVTNAQASLRFALESIVREVRTGRIDYSTYAASGGVSVPAEKLMLVNSDGEKEEFYLETNPAICSAPSTKCLVVKIDGGTPQSVTSSGVDVEQLTFYVSPQEDPFTVDQSTGSYASDKQPTVTVMLGLKTAGTASGVESASFNAQTTVTARTYVR